MNIKPDYINKLIQNSQFYFKRLVLNDIDNTTVLAMHEPKMADEEICLFHRDIHVGNDYIKILHQSIARGISERKEVPIVRFADGEYAFYNYDLHCNGLYRQAESVDAISEAMPAHVEALRILAACGKIAPLIFPGNITRKKRGFFNLLSRSKDESSASTFMKLLFDNRIELTADNYIPFYVVYAYLTSEDFIRIVDGKKVCILNSEFNRVSCTSWFSRLSSYPVIYFIEIPAEYVATRWGSIKEKILQQIPPDTNLCLVGAGIGSLPVCVDLAKRFSIPAIDAGHVLNMMNDRVDKSNGARLYTIRKTQP